MKLKGKDMPSQRQNTAHRDDSEKKAASQAEDDVCRCKQTSEMTPRELLKLMMRDLAFWKTRKN